MSYPWLPDCPINERSRMKILDVPQSGSVAGVTSSRNRFGQYRRTRATPVNPNSSYQTSARGRLATNAAAWRDLSQSQREGWATLGESMLRTDALGQSYNLTGLQAYESVNNNRLIVGQAVVANAPALATPDAMLTVAVSATAAAVSVTFTPTPIGAAEYLFFYFSPQRSAGRVFESDMRWVANSEAAAGSPLDLISAYTARFGVPVAGMRIFLELRRYSAGFLSTALLTSDVVE